MATGSCCEEKMSTMSKSRRAYPLAFREQMVELVRSVRSRVELAREFELDAGVHRTLGSASGGADWWSPQRRT